tara:strand:- start:512 stop:868 length:357 start_codon:yes stop_codon:yes gene_type:complete
VLLILSPIVCAQDITIEDLSPQAQASYKRLAKHLRCMTCPNQSIEDSNAIEAKMMRDQILSDLASNISEREIKLSMIERYGDRVTYEPVVNIKNSFLWIFPLILLSITFLYLYKNYDA